METDATKRGGDPRLVARVDKTTQKLIAQAAELSGTTISQFTIESVRERAEKVIDQMTRIQVSVDTGNRMLAILDRAPKKPSSKLIRNALDYKETINEGKTDTDAD